MGRKSRKRKNPDRYQGGTVIVNKIDYTRHDYISPGKLVAWAEWVPNERRQHSGKDISVPAK